MCGISDDVIKALALEPTGQRRVSTPSSDDTILDTYVVDLLLPNDVRIDDVQVVSSKIGSQGIGLLIGMDIISRGDVLITNSQKTIFSFRMPSESLPDFVTGITASNIIGRARGPGGRHKPKTKK